MSVLKVIEIMSNSPKGWDDAVENGIAKASRSVTGIKSAWIKEKSVTVNDGKISEYRVTLKISFDVK